jgi:hypothetical protein
MQPFLTWKGTNTTRDPLRNTCSRMRKPCPSLN